MGIIKSIFHITWASLLLSCPRHSHFASLLAQLLKMEIKNLFFAGRLTFVKHVLASMPLHIFVTFSSFEDHLFSLKEAYEKFLVVLIRFEVENKSCLTSPKSKVI